MNHRVPLLAVGVLLLVSVPVCGQEAAAPEIGKPYPALTLPSLADGKPLSISSFRGKKVLLIEFASW